ncbi:MAG: ABC transporter permease, partial [Pseudomonadota bacterium]
RARDGGAIDQAVFVALRRAGIEVSPIVEGALPTGGRRLRILGIEPVSLPGPALPAALTTGGGGGTRTDAETEPTGVPAFLRPPWQALASPETISELAGNTELPPRAEDRSLPPGLLVMDIGIAQQLLGLEGRLTRLVVAPGVEISEARLSEHGLSRIPAEEEGAEIGLTDSFHLNLTAFAFLSFAVGLLIVRAAIGLALEQRLATVRTLRACGVSARQITLAVLIEILILALVAGLAGLMLGYGIAAALLPDVSGSLRGLYGVAVSGSLTLNPAWALSGLAMAVLGGLAAAGAALWTVYHLPVLAAARPEAWQAAQARQARGGLALAGVFAALGVVLYLVGDSLFAGFATMGCALLTAALALPALLGWLLARLARLARSPLLEWAFADARQQLPGLTLALAALLLALAANIGVGTMVGGFRLTFLNWLDQRLAAEAYVRGATEAQSAEIDAWAARQPEIREVLPASAADIVWQGQPLEIRSAVDAATYRQDWPLLEASQQAWDTLFAGQGAMVSEQAANRLGLGHGPSIELGQGRREVGGSDSH